MSDSSQYTPKLLVSLKFNPLTTNPPIIEISHFICSPNQLTDFYMIGTLAVKELSTEEKLPRL